MANRMHTLCVSLVHLDKLVWRQKVHADAFPRAQFLSIRDEEVSDSMFTTNFTFKTFHGISKAIASTRVDFERTFFVFCTVVSVKCVYVLSTNCLIAQSALILKYSCGNHLSRADRLSPTKSGRGSMTVQRFDHESTGHGAESGDQKTTPERSPVRNGASEGQRGRKGVEGKRARMLLNHGRRRL